MTREYRITVGDDGKAELIIGTSVYIAPVNPNPLVSELVLRLDRFIGQHCDACEFSDLRLLGRALHQMLLEGGSVSEFVLSDRGERVPNKVHEGLHLGEFLWNDMRNNLEEDIRLSLEFKSRDDDLASFPWEFLFFSPPGQDGFFAAGEKISLSLTRRVEPVVCPREFGSAVNVWVVSAAPSSLGTVDNIGMIEGKIDDTLCKTLGAKLTTMRDTTWPKLKDALENAGANGPDFLHFIGHGRLEGGSAQIAMHADHQGSRVDAMLGLDERPLDVDWLDVRQVANAVSQRPPRLLFLQTCKSAALDRQVDGARNAAQEFAAVEVPFVVAMQYEIENKDAGIFAQAFYQALSKGSSVDYAVRAGRIKLGSQRPAWEHRRFATPVVYLRSDEPVMAMSERPTPVGSSDGRTCPYAGCRKILENSDSTECDCEEYNAIQWCENDHPNRPDAEKCWYRYCGVKLEPVSAPARSSVKQIGERGQVSPRGRATTPAAR